MVKIKLGGHYRTEAGEKIGPMLRAWCGGGRSFSNGDNIDDQRRWLIDGACDFEGHAVIAEWQDEPAEVIGENVRAVMINEAPDDVFERMAETRCKPYDAPRSKYHRIIKGVEVDIYDILVAWGVTCPARQHAIKKLLMAGERGAKGVAQDLGEAIQATERAKELLG